VVKANKAGKNIVNIAYVFANNFHQCKYCFTDLAGKDSLASIAGTSNKFETLKRESFSSPFILLDPLLLPSKLSLDKDFELMLFYSKSQSYKTFFL
jgi:hypothetical protein